MAQSLFIYWHVTPTAQAAAEAAARLFQAELATREPAVLPRLFRRSDAANGRVTLMETYAAASGLPPSVLQRLVDDSAHALGPLAEGGRHVEVFEDAS